MRGLPALAIFSVSMVTGCSGPSLEPDGGWLSGDGGAAADAGIDTPDAGSGCVWSVLVHPCGFGRYCQAPGCGTGTCAAVETSPKTARAVVCGCDGLTYWNASLAAQRGVPVRATGA